MSKDFVLGVLQEENEENKQAIELWLSKDMTPSVKAFEKLGFCFKGEDGLRYLTTLPKGWTYTLDDYQQKEGYIFDNKGRKRVKFCFEDKYIGDYPFMYTQMLNRFSIVVTAGKTVQVQTEDGIKEIGTFKEQDHQQFNKLWKKASECLDSMYPQWRNPTQYWDD